MVYDLLKHETKMFETDINAATVREFDEISDVLLDQYIYLLSC